MTPTVYTGVGAAADSLNDAQLQLATVSTYLVAAAAGTATAAQLTAAQTALVVAQADINNASGGAAPPVGTWIQGKAAAAIAVATGLLGAVAGYAIRGRMMKEKRR
jgi:hypothetical protein